MTTEADTRDKDIVVNAINAGNFTTLASALKSADLITTYKGIGPFTFFAPTDDAFRKMPAGELEALLANKPKLASVLNFHVMKGAVLMKDFKSRDSRSMQGEKLTIATSASGFTVNGVKNSRQQIEASNGVIHGIDTVMMPAVRPPA